MKRLIYSIIILLFATIQLGCEKETLLYKGEEDGASGIYFYSVATTTIDGIPLSYRDSLTYSFQNDPLIKVQHVFNVPVRTLGNISDQDRNFKVKVIGGTAREGIDYEPLKESYVLPAGKSVGSIPVVLFRTPVLTEKAITIDLELVEYEGFKLLLPYLLNIGNNKQMDATKFRINFSELITEPSYYESFGRDYFGEWTAKKFKILNDLMGWTVNDWRYAGFSGYPVASGKFTYAAILFKTYLEDKVKEKQPVYEADGKTFMQLGPSYMVDYSGL